MAVNFGDVSKDYAKYRDRLPKILFDQLAQKEVQIKNQKIIDLGSGSGIFSRDLVKHGARVIGIEPSQELIDEAKIIDSLESIDTIEYIKSKAEDFHVEDKLRIITAVRAWHWFDRIKVIENIKNHMELNGLLIVINSIFLPNSEVAQITFNVLTNNNIELKPAGSNAEAKERRNGFPANWFKEWEDNSFQVIEEWNHEYNLDFTHEEWCGKIRSVSWLSGTSNETRMKVTNELIEKLKDYNEILTIPHRFSVVILRYS